MSRRPHQQRALDAVAFAYRRAARCQIHWAPGTGKTREGRWLAEDLDASTVVVFVPSLALIAQTLAEWQSTPGWDFTPLVVCSDRTTVDSWRIEPGWWGEHGTAVTTDPGRVAAFLRGRSDRPRVVLSTYHSAAVVAAGAARAGAVADLLVCDEAHRLAGRPDERFDMVLHDHHIRARRRLFATATPITATDLGARSMSDMAMFGPVADRISVADAIQAGLLVDYRILVLDAAGGTADLDPYPSVTAALVAASPGLSRVMSYHSRVYHARRFASEVDGLVLPDGRTVRAFAVAGTDPATHRDQVLRHLADGAPNTLTLVTNARCLSEGVDVPAVDGVLIASPKTSETDIVQAIGRALRPAPGKTHGTVILPVALPKDEHDDEAFVAAWASVWGVLRALRNLDPRLAAEIDQGGGHRDWYRSPNGWAGVGPNAHLRFRLDEGVDLNTLMARVVEPGGSDTSWDHMFGLLADWCARNSIATLSSGTWHKGEPVGRWAGGQRKAYAVGGLSAYRASRLSGIPGWAWTLEQCRWTADHAHVAALAAERDGLDLNDPQVATARMPHRRHSALTVGRWAARQRRAAKEGALADWQARACEQLPGWTWDGDVPDRDGRMVDAWVEWMDAHRDANVPHDARWGPLPLGAFVTAVRRRAVVGALLPALADDIAVVTPPKHQPGALDWRPLDTRWEMHWLALMQFARRTGGCDIPENGTEEFHGREWSIGDWASRHRHFYRHGNLDPKRAELLEQIPGWTWERQRKVRVVVGIGARQHGTRLGYAAGCLCEPCTAANAAYEAERQRLRAAGEATTDLVDARAACGHLRILEGRVGVRARPIARDLTGLNKKTIDEIANGTRARIHPEVDRALRALTVGALLDYIDANPSTRDMLPAGPTMAAIESLTRRGFPRAWISREIGGPANSLQVGRAAEVRRETAEAVADLVRRVGSRVAPPKQHRKPMPTLAEILAAEHSREAAA